MIDNLIAELEATRNSLSIAEEHYQGWKSQLITKAFMLDLQIAQANCLDQLSDIHPGLTSEIAALQAVYKQFTDLIEWLPQELIEDN